MHKFIKIFLTSLIAVLIVSSQVLAAPIFDISKIASSSNAMFADAQELEIFASPDYSIQPLADVDGDGLPSVENTTSMDETWMQIEYMNNEDNRYHYQKVEWDKSTRHFGPTTWNISGDYEMHNLIFYLPASALPSAGKYRMRVKITQDVENAFSSFVLVYQGTLKNAQKFRYKSPNIPFESYADSDYYMDFVVNIPFITNNGVFQFYIHVSDGQQPTTFAGYLDVEFTKMSSDTEVFWDPVSQSGQTSGDISQDLQTNIANSSSTTAQNTTNIANSSSQTAQNTQQLVQGQNLIIDELQNLVQHISNQLYAFWDQLYNLIHLPEFQVFNDILDAINNLDIQIDVNLNSLVSAIETQSTAIQKNVTDNIDKQLQNDNKNADRVINGYDNQSIIDDNNRLSDTLTDLENAEDALFDDAKDNLNQWAPGDMLQEFVASLSLVSDFLQAVYTTLGNLAIPVAFSLTLAIALMLIGYYRFKGGL